MNKHIIEVAIPLADTLDVPIKAPATLPSPPEYPVLGPKADVDVTTASCYAGRIMWLKSNAYKKPGRQREKVIVILKSMNLMS